MTRTKAIVSAILMTLALTSGCFVWLAYNWIYPLRLEATYPGFRVTGANGTYDEISSRDPEACELFVKLWDSEPMKVNQLDPLIVRSPPENIIVGQGSQRGWTAPGDFRFDENKILTKFSMGRYHVGAEVSMNMDFGYVKMPISRRRLEKELGPPLEFRQYRQWNRQIGPLNDWR